jgi:hypothetical protein
MQVNEGAMLLLLLLLLPKVQLSNFKALSPTVSVLITSFNHHGDAAADGAGDGDGKADDSFRLLPPTSTSCCKRRYIKSAMRSKMLLEDGEERVLFADFFLDVSEGAAAAAVAADVGLFIKSDEHFN